MSGDRSTLPRNGPEADSGERPDMEDAVVDLTGRSLKYHIGKGDDVSFAGRKRQRFTVLMAGTEGASPETIATALRRIAMKRLSGRHSPKAVIVFAYRPGDDTANAYTIGRVIATKDGLAWNGEQAREQPYFEIDLGSVL